MNLPTKLTVSRIVMTILIIIILLFPFDAININFPQFYISDILVDSRYLIAGGLFIIASAGYICPPVPPAAITTLIFSPLIGYRNYTTYY